MNQTHLLLKDIRDSTKILSTDYTHKLVANYLKAWETIIAGLDSHEQTLRYASMLGIRALGKYCNRALADTKLRETLLLKLARCAYDEDMETRTLACVCIGLCVYSFSDSSELFPTFKLCFDIVLLNFSKLFPMAVQELESRMFDTSANVTKQKFECRIRMIAAISYFIDLRCCASETFYSYIDTLFGQILRSSANPLLHAVVVNAITDGLSKTNRNRKRVDRFYRKPMADLIETASYPKNVSKASLNYLEKALSKFASKWYPLPSDAALLFRDMNEDVEKLDGYAAKRWDYLVGLDSSDSMIEDLPTEDKIALIIKADLPPYKFNPKAILAPRNFNVITFDDTYSTSELHPKDISTAPVIVPKKGSISFNLKTPFIEFNRSPNSTKLYLDNLDETQSHYFYIQQSHPEYYSAVPSFGELKPLERREIILSFSPIFLNSPGRIKAYFILRSKDGFPMERIDLSAFNLPAISVSSTELNFGLCPPFEMRTTTIAISNLLSIDCGVMLLLVPSPQSTTFQLPFSQLAIPPNETRHVSITATPDNNGPKSGELILIGHGGHMVRIKLKLYCGESIKVMESKLNFGITDIFFGSIKRYINIQNKDLVNALPITFECTTNEVTLDEGKSIVLPPGGFQTIPVSFLSSLTGSRHEKLTLYAPNSHPQTVELIVSSGPILKVPVHRDIYFPSAFTGETTFVRIPISNALGHAVNFVLYSSKGFPLTFNILPYSYSNRAKGQFDQQPYIENDMVGIKSILPSNCTAVIEIAFQCINPGLFKIPVYCMTRNPQKVDIGEYHLHCAVFDEDYLSSTLNNTVKLRQFYEKPYQSTFSDLEEFFNNGNQTPKKTISDIFQITPPLQTIFGANSALRPSETLQYFHLINLTPDNQRYRIILTAHFKTDVPTEGEIPGNSFLDVPIRIDPSFVVDVESKHFTAFGCITVLDSDFRSPGVAVSQIVGTIGELFTFEVRESIPSIKLPNIDVMETSKRFIYVRNKSCLPIDCSVKLDNTTGKDSEYNPFNVLTRTIKLLPYELYNMEVTLKPSPQGYFKTTLVLNYNDPDNSTDNSNKTITARTVGPIVLTCTVGNQELITSPDYLSFGDINIDDVVTHKLMLLNEQNIEATVHMSMPEQFEPQPVAYCKARSTFEYPIVFSPDRHCQIQTQLAFNVTGKTLTVPVLARAGTIKVNSKSVEVLQFPDTLDPADRLEIKPQPQNIFDIGDIALSAKKNCIVSLANAGTLDLNIKKMFAKSDQLLSIKVANKAYVGSLSNIELVCFGQNNIDAKEIDIDNFWFLSQTTAPLPVYLRPRHSIAFAKRAGSIVTTHRKYSKIFRPSTDIIPEDEQAPPKYVEENILASQVRVEPLRKFDIEISVTPDETREFLEQVCLQVEQAYRMPLNLMFWVKGRSFKPLMLSTKSIDFGVVRVSETCTSTLKFTNEEEFPLPWSIAYDSSVIEDEYETPIPGYSKLKSPIKLFPSSGVLNGGASQTVDLQLTPTIPEAKMYSLIKLTTNGTLLQDIVLEVFGATSIPKIDATHFDFQTLRVGMKKTMEFKISNEGTLPFNFFISSTNPEFIVEPEQGLVRKGGYLIIRVQFSPSKEGKSKGKLLIQTNCDFYRPPATISLVGKGSYPKIQVITKTIDFGTALFKSVNKSSFEVRNNGLAAAKIVFECNHPDIKIDDSSDDNLEVAPNQTKRITVLYYPKTVEKLLNKAFIYSSDCRGETFMLYMKADVGIPQLAVIPPDALDSINFGVVRVERLKSYKFKILNEGTIHLNFKTNLQMISVLKNANSKAPSAMKRRQAFGDVICPITIETPEGRLGVGETIEIVLTFNPKLLAKYEYEFKLTYEYFTYSTTIIGVGGKSEASLLLPLSTLDFELCRLNRDYRKSVLLKNAGNLGVTYFVRPEPPDGNWSVYDEEVGVETEDKPIHMDQNAIAKTSWYEYLESKGLRILNPVGFCEAFSNFSVNILFHPKTPENVIQNFRVYHDGNYDFFTMIGKSSVATLLLEDPQTNQFLTSDTPELNIGVHPVKYQFSYHLKLINNGLFGVDFLVQPMSTIEFEVHPLRGYIEPNSTIPITILFQPSSESRFHSKLKIIWEGEPISINISGDGGVGQLEMKFLSEKDILLKSLDFGMVPFNTPHKKRFFVANYGLVGVKAMLEVENIDYSISLLSSPISNELTSNPKDFLSKELFTSWSMSLQLYLPPDSAILIGVRFQPHGSTTSVGDITIRSDSGNFTVPLKGKGGTLNLAHKGDLEFGDISCNFTYSRKITIRNNGSIPALLTAYWLVVGISNEQMSNEIKVGEVYSSTDPRSQWARQQLLKERGEPMTNAQLKPKDYWRLIAMSIRKDAVKDSGTKPEENDPKGRAVIKRVVNNTNATHFKRRQVLYHLITTTQLTSQSTCRVSPFVKISPADQLIQSYGEVTFLVELNLGSEDTFLATLVIKPEVTNCQNYEIPLTATPKFVNILCDDTRMLNFYRQPLGETETLFRTFTNVGHKEVPFTIRHSNAALTVSPAKGVLKIGATIKVSFAFHPTEEAAQTSPVIFDPLFSQTITFKMYGGGGYAKASLSRYRRFDFGHCMIGKDTVSHLPITNEGNAILHLTKFLLDETDTFFKGQSWPTSRISLFPDASYNLPLVFHPHEENPLSGSLVIATNSESFEIELIGLGREAVLIVSRIAIEFQECLIGNTYEQKLGLKNIGDVNYPVTCQLEKTFPDISFQPSSLTISPFSESFVTITYTPTQQIKSNVTFILASPYSTHKVPIMVHAGIAYLEFESSELDYGMFEKSTTPSVTLTMKNSGTVKTNFFVKDNTKPPIFLIEPYKGVLHPKKSIDIKVTHRNHEVSQIEEKLIIRTDLVDKIYTVNIRGKCEETILHPDEFSLLNLGICPVLEPSSKALNFTNYGKFPLQFSIVSVYPLKAAPTEGSVLGGETGTVYVTWNPSGGYELRTQLVINTNIGKFPLFVRGKSMLPELHVSNTYIDYGVCAIGYTYHQFVTLVNRGKVKLYFNIPPCRDNNYVTSLTSGVLEPKEEAVIDILFTPKIIGKITSSLIVDCRGIHYKEVLLVGIGGIMKLEVSPKSLDLESCPYGLEVFEIIQIANMGEVTLHLDFSHTRKVQGKCHISVPDAFDVPPGETGNCKFGFSSFSTDRFYAKVCISTYEQTFVVPVTGVGIKIVLTKKSKEILQKEKFPIIENYNALYIPPRYKALEYAISKLQGLYLYSMDFYDFLTALNQQHITYQEEADYSQLSFGVFRRISFARDMKDVNVNHQFQAVADSVDTLHPLKEDEMEAITEENPTEVAVLPLKTSQPLRRLSFVNYAESVSEFPEPNGKLLKTPSLGAIQPISEEPSSIRTDTSPFTSEKSRILEVSEKELPAISKEQSLALKDEGSIIDLDSELISFEPEQSVAISEQKSTADSQLPTTASTSEFNTENTPDSSRGSNSLLAKLKKNKEALKQPEFEPFEANLISNAFETDEPIDELKQNIKNTENGIRKLFKMLESKHDPFNPVNMHMVNQFADKFIEMKYSTPPKDEPSDIDRVIEEVINYGRLNIELENLEDLLTAEENFEPLDLMFLTKRPLPFEKEKELELQKTVTRRHIMDRKAYMSHYPKLNRGERNAHSNPFETSSPKIDYGNGVRLYTKYQ